MENYEIIEQAKKDFTAKTGFTPEQMGTPVVYRWQNSVIFASSERVINALLKEWQLNRVILTLTSVILIVAVCGIVITILTAFYSARAVVLSVIATVVCLGVLGLVFLYLSAKRRKCQRIHQNQFFIKHLKSR